MSLRKSHKLSMSKTRTRSFGLSALVALTAACLLSGCVEGFRGEEIQPPSVGGESGLDGLKKPSDSAGLGASPSSGETDPEPGTSEPTQPAEALESDAFGAVSAAEYFFDLYNYSIKTGDINTFDQISADSCDFCSETIAQVRGQDEANLHQRGGVLAYEYVGIPSDYEDRKVIPVQFDVVEEDVELVDSDGKVVFTQPASLYKMEVYLKPHDDAEVGWLVAEVKGSVQ